MGKKTKGDLPPAYTGKKYEPTDVGIDLTSHKIPPAGSKLQGGSNLPKGKGFSKSNFF